MSAESSSTLSIDDEDHGDDDVEYNTSTMGDFWYSVAESSARISLAGFAGSLVGVVKERQLRYEIIDEPTAKFSKALVKSMPRRPPRLPTSITPSSLPVVWSIGCIMFASVLETCRLVSPTTFLLDMSGPQKVHAEKVGLEVLPIHEAAILRGFTSFGDYTIGGTVAGVAGAIGQRRRIPLTAFGLGTGMLLGAGAGTIQALLDVCNVYLEREVSEREFQQMQEKDQAEQELLDEYERGPRYMLENSGSDQESLGRE